MFKQIIVSLTISLLLIIDLGRVSAQIQKSQTQISIPIKALEGLVYIDFPKKLCEMIEGRGSFDGSFNTSVCQRGRHVFFILNREVNITSNGERVWRIVKIKELPQQLTYSNGSTNSHSICCGTEVLNLKIFRIVTKLCICSVDTNIHHLLTLFSVINLA